MVISNEVLAERIEGFTRQNLAESQQVRRDLSVAIEEMGRVKDAVTLVAESLSRHEQLDGHRVSVLHVQALQKDSDKARIDIERLNELVSLKADVTQLKIVVTEVKAKQESQDYYKAGRQSALSTAEKMILLCVAISGPLFLVLERFG